MHILPFSTLFWEVTNWTLQWIDQKISIQNLSKFSKFKFCDLNQDLVGYFQDIFNYQQSILASKFIVYGNLFMVSIDVNVYSKSM